MTRSPARRVIYRSHKARVARVGLGVLLAAVTLWIVLPVLGTSHAPPAPSAIFIGTDANNFNLPRAAGTYGSIAYLQVSASECRDPATVYGTLIRSPATRAAELEGRHRGTSPPKQALVTIYGARVKSFVIGLSSPPLFATFVTHTGELGTFDEAGVLTVHNTSLPLIRRNGATTAILNAPAWPATNAVLHFVAKVDLVRPAGFHSCYLDLPQLLSFEEDNEQRAYERAATISRDISDRVPRLADMEFPDEEDIEAGDVRATVTGRILEPSTIGDGEAIASGVRYRCQNTARRAVPRELDPAVARPFVEPRKPDCSGTPLFQAVDATSDTTRRLFAAGILGALGATVIVETLFVAETEGRTRRRRRRRTAT